MVEDEIIPQSAPPEADPWDQDELVLPLSVPTSPQSEEAPDHGHDANGWES